MNIVVTLKQVPNPNIPPSHFTLDATARHAIPPFGIPPVINGYDENALEEGLRLRERHGGQVTVLSVGDDDSRESLKRAAAMGADAVILIKEPSLLDFDSAGTALALAAGIRKLGNVDLVLCGRQASDTDAGQVLHGIAELLDLPAVSPVSKIEEIDGQSMVVHRIREDGHQRIRVQLPALLGISSEINEPRYPPPKGLMAAGRSLIPSWTADDLGLDPAARKVELRRLVIQEQVSNVELVRAASPAAAGSALADKLHDEGLV